MSTTCQHISSDTFSGDLICIKCGQVLQSNSQLSLEPAYLDRGTLNYSNPATIKLSHQERSELFLHTLARKLIASFALKPSYETESLELMQKYWTSTGTKQRYGLAGNRLLIAAIFLLARRDHLAVNLTLLAASIDSTPQECGALFDPLIKIDPSLRSLAQISDFVERSVDLLVNELSLQHGLVVVDSNQLHSLLIQQTRKIAHLLQEEERGASKSAECTALAAAWISLAALLVTNENTAKIKLEPVVQSVCDSSTLAFRSVKTKHSLLIDKLLERATELLPSTFTLTLTRPRKISLLLINLNLII